MINRFFVLGGEDGEMLEIKKILGEKQIPWIQPFPGWGPKEIRMEEIAQAMVPGHQVVFVEIAPPVDFPRVRSMVVVDHHGDNAAMPASILQVLDLLHLAPTRHQQLIAANDSGWFPGMLSLGATLEEVLEIRDLCRKAHGARPDDPEIMAEVDRALAAPVEMIGDIRVIRMSHSKCGPVVDRLAIEAIANNKPIPACLILSGDGEVNLMGNADGAMCKALFEKYRAPHPAKGMVGGDGIACPGKPAYFVGYPDQEEVVEFIRNYLGL